MLNNDILAIMFTSAVVWMLAVGLRKRFPTWSLLLMGLFLGLAILAKGPLPLLWFVLVTLVVCALWVRFVGRGPLESLMRLVTVGTYDPAQRDGDDPPARARDAGPGRVHHRRGGRRGVHR